MPRSANSRQVGQSPWLTARSEGSAGRPSDVTSLVEESFVERIEGGLHLAFDDDAETSPSAYVEQFTLVRERLLRIVGAQGRPLEERLLGLMDVADRVSEYFDENSTNVDRRQLERDLEWAAGDHCVAGWTDVMTQRIARYYLEELTIDEVSPWGRLVSTIRSFYGLASARARLGALTDGEALAVHDPFAAAGPWPGGVGRLSREEETVLRLYRRQRALLLLSNGRRIEHHLTNYCLNYVLVERYIDWPSLRYYVQELALRVASFRFLLFSHPGTRAVWDKGADSSECGEAEGEVWASQVLDRIVAETRQCVSRAADCSNLFTQLRRVTRIDETPGVAGLAALVTM